MIRAAPRLLFLLAAFLQATPLSALPLQVVAGEGRPVAEARVEVWEPPARGDLLGALLPPVAQGDTDTEGFLPPLPTLPRLLVTVDHPSFAPLVVEHGSQDPRRLILQPGFVWQGRVTFAGEHADAGTVCASWEQGYPGWQRSFTWQRCAVLATQGTFTLVGLPETKVTLKVEADGYLPLAAEIDPRDPPALRLRPGIALSGRVTTTRGRAPVADARIRAVGGGATTSDPAGHFTVTAATLPVALRAQARGFRPGILVVEKIPKDLLVLALQPSEQVYGTLLDDRGAPVREASVGIEQHRSVGSSRFHNEALELDEEGRFLLELAGPGNYQLRLRAAGYREESLPALEVAAGEAVALGTLTLDRGAVIQGRLFDAVEGIPVAAAALRLVPRGVQLLSALRQAGTFSTTSDPDGNFTFSGLSEGAFELRVSHERYALQVLAVDLKGREEADLGEIGLSAGVRLQGKVVDREGAPRAGLAIRILPPDRDSLLAIAERHSDGAGEFVVEKQAPGRYQVEVHGERLLLAREVLIPEEETVFPLELAVGGVRLQGTVIRGGEPVSGGRLHLSTVLDPGHRQGKILMQAAAGGAPAFRHGMAQSRLTTQVSDVGTFTLDDVPTGALRATYRGAGEPVVRQILVLDQPVTRVTLDLAGLELTGTVVDGTTGTGIPAALRIIDPLGAVVARGEALDGFFTLHDLAPGTFRVEARSPGYSSEVLENVSVDGRQPSLRIPLEPKEVDKSGDSGTLTVVLRRSSGEPAAGVPVTLLDGGGQMAASLLTDGYGTKRFTQLPPGSYFVVWSDPLAGAGLAGPVRLEGHTPQRMEQTLVPGVPVRILCDAAVCVDGRIDTLAVFTAAGIDLGPYLSGVSPAMGFSAEGAVTLGRLAPGSYLLSLWSHGRRLDRPVVLQQGSTHLRFP